MKKIKEIIVAKNIGYCFGVKKAIELALNCADKNVCTLGKIIHNDSAIKMLESKGIFFVDSVDKIKTKGVIIRSHGIAKDVYSEIEAKGIKIFDATCPFVYKIQKKVQEFYLKNYKIIIIGQPNHAEVIGINGWCEYSASVIESEADAYALVESELLSKTFDKACIVCQTTFSKERFDKLVKILSKLDLKTVEIFDTICYTTIKRQLEAAEIAKKADLMLVLGSSYSSNTNKLLDICAKSCENSFLISSLSELYLIDLYKFDCIGIVAGASTSDELIQEVLQYMSENNGISFKDMFEEESYVEYKRGSRIDGAEIISVTPAGITVKIGGKNDGFVAAEDAEFEKEFNPSDYAVGAKLDVMIKGPKDKDTGLIPVSKKEIDAIKISDTALDGIRNGEEFQMVVKKVLDKGLRGRIGNYKVFVPQSHIQEYFVKNLQQYYNKTLRLRMLEIDDERKEIVASQKVIIAEERKEKEDYFFEHVQPETIVIGKVMRAAPFGAFVDVGGVDCLAHITDLSWNKIDKVEDVLTINEEYEFVVLKCDRETKKVSLGYKQLQPHPFYAAAEKYKIGDIIDGKVIRLAPFGAFVEIEKGLDGLVHISEAGKTYVKNIAEVLKAGQEVKAVITKIDTESRHISLSVKAALENEPVEASAEETAEAPVKKTEKKKKKTATETSTNEWSEDASNNVFADLLKDINN